MLPPGELARIAIRQTGGIELEYRFGNWQLDIPLAADLFRFQVPVGVAIVDGASLSESAVGNYQYPYFGTTLVG